MHKILKMYSKKGDFINYERMSFNMKKVLAIDLGASSGRGIIAKIEDGKINLKEILSQIEDNNDNSEDEK